MLLSESIFCGLGAVIVICFANEIGQRCSNTFTKIDDVSGQMKWYFLPKELQRLLPIAIINIQEPVGLRFFGSYFCGREQFKKVRFGRLKIRRRRNWVELNVLKTNFPVQMVNKAYSFYMVLHELYNWDWRKKVCGIEWKNTRDWRATILFARCWIESF